MALSLLLANPLEVFTHSVKVLRENHIEEGWPCPASTRCWSL